jgi:hypothetical protein
MTDMTNRGDWRPEKSTSLADRLIDGTLRLFLTEPVAASAGVLIIVAALSNSGLAGFVAFAIAMLFASQLRARYERDL